MRALVGRIGAIRMIASEQPQDLEESRGPFQALYELIESIVALSVIFKSKIVPFGNLALEGRLLLMLEVTLRRRLAAMRGVWARPVGGSQAA